MLELDPQIINKIQQRIQDAPILWASRGSCVHGASRRQGGVSGFPSGLYTTLASYIRSPYGRHAIKNKGWIYLTDQHIGFISDSSIKGKDPQMNIPAALTCFIFAVLSSIFLGFFTHNTIQVNMPSTDFQLLIIFLSYLLLLWVCFAILPLYLAFKFVKGIDLIERHADLLYPLYLTESEWYLDKTNANLVMSCGVPRFVFDSPLPSDIFPPNKAPAIKFKPQGYWIFYVIYSSMAILGFISVLPLFVYNTFNTTAQVQDFITYIFVAGMFFLLLSFTLLCNYAVTHEFPTKVFPPS